MRRLLLLGAILTALAFSGNAQAVQLVTPAGQPVGSQVQRWIDHSQIPTARALVIYEPISQLCGGFQTDGCSMNLFGTAPNRLAASDSDAMYAELGHIFDWTTLTDAARMRFRQIWHVPSTTRWENSTSAFLRGHEDGLTGDFSAAYALCAEGAGGFVNLQASDAPIIHETSGATCRLIRATA